MFNAVLCIAAVVIIVRVWRGLKQVNEFMPWVACLLATAMIFSYWTYNRTEPAFLTPVVDQLTQILPTKSKHEQDLDRMRKSRE